MKKLVIGISLFTIALISDAQTIYTVDKNHFKVGFSATHFGISHVEGRFKNCSATLKSQKEDFTDAVIEMTAETKSIDTDIEMRDNDLRSDKWLDAEKFPTITFKSLSFKKINGNNYKLLGNLTIHGITKFVSLDVVYNGKALNPKTKKSSVGFTITGKINRNDYLVGTGGGNNVVSDEIELKANAEFIIN